MSYSKEQAVALPSISSYSRLPSNHQLLFLIIFVNVTRRSLLGLAEDAASHVALAEVVLNSALLGGGGLCEGSGATERTSESGVLHADNADVLGATGGTLASHTLGHLDLFVC